MIYTIYPVIVVLIILSRKDSQSDESESDESDEDEDSEPPGEMAVDLDPEQQPLEQIASGSNPPSRQSKGELMSLVQDDSETTS